MTVYELLALVFCFGVLVTAVTVFHLAELKNKLDRTQADRLKLQLENDHKLAMSEANRDTYNAERLLVEARHQFHLATIQPPPPEPAPEPAPALLLAGTEGKLPEMLQALRRCTFLRTPRQKQLMARLATENVEDFTLLERWHEAGTYPDMLAACAAIRKRLHAAHEENRGRRRRRP